MKKLLMLIPVYQSVPAAGFSSIMNAYKSLKKYYDIDFIIHTGSYVAVARNALFKEAWRRNQEDSIDYVLCVDTDQVFSTNDVLNLIKHYDAESYQFLSGDIYIRDHHQNATIKSMAYDITESGRVQFKPLSAENYTEVSGTGFGFLLLSGKVLDKVVEKMGDSPLFDTKITGSFHDDSIVYTGEDVWFFKRIKQLGMKVAVDNQVHIGHFGFSK